MICWPAAERYGAVVVLFTSTFKILWSPSNPGPASQIRDYTKE